MEFHFTCSLNCEEVILQYYFFNSVFRFQLYQLAGQNQQKRRILRVRWKKTAYQQIPFLRATILSKTADLTYRGLQTKGCREIL